MLQGYGGWSGMLKMVSVRSALLGLVSLAVLVVSGCGTNSTSISANQTATPTFSPGGGTYNSSKAVTVADSTSGAVLYCTTDGTTPTTSSPKCAQPTTVYQTQFLQAIAVAPGKQPSGIASAAYTIDLSAAATPTFSPAGGTYAATQNVTIADTTTGANIYYTLDGTTPTASSLLYAGPVSVSTTETISAIAVASGYSNSGVAAAQYTIGAGVSAPVFSVPSGSYSSAQSVTITDSTPNTVIYYSINDSTPSASATMYTGAIAVSQTETISATAILPDGTFSAITTVAYTIGVSGVPPPSFTTPAGSIISSGGTVVLADGDPNATIYYTIDGTQPSVMNGTPSGTTTQYMSPGIALSIAGSVTINAIAVDNGTSSTVNSAQYTVAPTSVPAPTIAPATGATFAAGGMVTLSDGDTNAVIHYTIDGSTPTAASATYSAPFALTTAGKITVNAIAIDTGTSSTVTTAAYTVTPASVPAPTFNPASGTVILSGKTVTLADADANATIYYTEDGSQPSASSSKYTAPITFTTSGPITINAIAVDGSASSTVATANYSLAPASVPPPTFSPANGTFPSGETISIADTDTNAVIHYTVDNSTPTATSPTYTSGVTLSTVGSATIKAIAVDSTVSSSVATATYTVTAATVAAPVISPATGTSFTTGGTVTITETDAKAKIYYTIDGTTPSASSTVYASGGFVINTTGTVVVKAIAIDGANASAVVTATYTVSPASVATPTFTPPSGTTLASGQTISIVDSDSKAAIYYTTDGTTPTASSAKYTVPITLTTAGIVTVKAIAIDTGTSSAVATATYTVPVTVPAPTFTPPSGTTLTGGQTISIADTDTNAGVAIYYATNGTAPTNASTKYTGPFTLSTPGSVTVKAITYDGAAASPVATATYTVPVPAPTFSPAGGNLTVGQSVTIADTDTSAVVHYTLTGAAPTGSSPTSTGSVTFSQAGTVNLQAIAIDGALNSSITSATYTVAPAGPSVTGKVFSGPGTSTPIANAMVQLYAAGQGTGDTAYGAGATVIGSTTTDSTGAFSVSLGTCTASTQPELVYLVATGGDAGKGTNTDIQLMTALGPCTGVSTTSPYVINEVTTVASAYVLSPFMTTAPIVGSSTTNYVGLSNAFATVNNLVNVTTGASFTHTPAYPTDLTGDPNIVNNSTVPQARIYTLANILNGCVNSAGSCPLLSDAMPVGGPKPTTTLQAILDIAQNPGNNVSGLYALGSSKVFTPNLSGAPNDFTLALTFTGGGLGIGPNITNGMATYNGQTTTGLGQSVNSALAIDANGNVWVTGGAEPSGALGTVGSSVLEPILAGFNNLGAPLTPATSLTAGSSPVITYGGFNPLTPAAMSVAPSVLLGPDAFDQAGNLWVGDATAGFTFQVKTGSSPSTVTSTQPGSAKVLSLTIDGKGNPWLGQEGGELYELKPGTGATLIQSSGQPSNTSSPLFTDLGALTFDSNGELWGWDINQPSGDDVFQIDPQNGYIQQDLYPMGNNGSFFSLPLVADNQGNVYGCGDSGGVTLDKYAGGALVSSVPLSVGCGSELLLDGDQRIYSVFSGYPAPVLPPPNPSGVSINVSTLAGASISPESGYTGTGNGEQPTINSDPNFIGNAPLSYSILGTAAIDNSGNLWVLNPDTGATGATGNVLVEFVGLAAPVVTPTSVALKNGSLGTRP